MKNNSGEMMNMAYWMDCETYAYYYECFVNAENSYDVWQCSLYFVSRIKPAASFIVGEK